MLHRLTTFTRRAPPTLVSLVDVGALGLRCGLSVRPRLYLSVVLLPVVNDAVPRRGLRVGVLHGTHNSLSGLFEFNYLWRTLAFQTIRRIHCFSSKSGQSVQHDPSFCQEESKQT
jgi:hypothetical protein